MITLLLIRHGIAEDFQRGQRDEDRALTPEGWSRTRSGMQGLVARGYLPDLGICSPYRRAAETLVCLKESTPHGFPSETCGLLLPEGKPLEVEFWLRGILEEVPDGRTVALVSHQPFLSSLVFQLTGHRVDFKKASCSILHWRQQAFEFALHLTPSELRNHP
nr:hypothetical protein [uncultured Holophaga sp.]